MDNLEKIHAKEEIKSGQEAYQMKIFKNSRESTNQEKKLNTELKK